ncbi:MAG: hypothetical protein ACLP56_02835 [Candidatus Sulfotelmatobacter sp.]
MKGEVSSLPEQVELLDVQGLVREGEADRILIMEFDVFKVERESGEVPVKSPERGMAEWTAEIDGAGGGGRSGELGSEIEMPEGVEIKLIHAKREVDGIVIAQLDIAADE